MSLKRHGGRHQSVLNLDCEKIDRENNTLQEVKSKSIEDEAKKNLCTETQHQDRH